MTRAPRFPALVGAALTTVLLAACGGPVTPAPSDPAGVPPAAPTATVPTPTAPPTDAAGELLGCDDLAPSGTFDGMFALEIAPVGPERTIARLSTAIDEWWVATEAGGLACEWQNAEAAVGSEGFHDYSGVRIMLAPISEAGWGSFAGTRGDDILECDEGLCRRDTFTNGWWLSLFASELTNGTRLAAARDAFDAIVAEVTALPATEPATPPSTIADDCAGVLPARDLARTLGVSASAVRVRPQERRLPHVGVLHDLGGVICDIGVNDVVVATVETLPGGADSAAAAIAAYLAISPGAEQRLDVPGLAQPGSLRDQAEGRGIDITVEGDWVKILGWDRVGSLDYEQTIVALAEAVVAAR